jgi:hypothetical protein
MPFMVHFIQHLRRALIKNCRHHSVYNLSNVVIFFIDWAGGYKHYALCENNSYVSKQKLSETLI